MGLLNNKEMSYGGVVIVGLSSLPKSRKCVFFFFNVFLGKKVITMVSNIHYLYGLIKNLGQNCKFMSVKHKLSYLYMSICDSIVKPCSMTFSCSD